MKITPELEQELTQLFKQRYKEVEPQDLQLLVLDVIECCKQSTKKSAVKLLLENSHFVEWSNREIARILECSHSIVSDVRKQMELGGEIIKFQKRSYIRNGKRIELKNKDSTHSFDRLAGQALIYIIEAGETKLFKIGYTNNLKRRFDEISTGCPQQPKIKYYILCKNDASAKKIEQLFHQELAYKRVRPNGEWFVLTDEDISRLKSIAIDNSLIIHVFDGHE